MFDVDVTVLERAIGEWWNLARNDEERRRRPLLWIVGDGDLQQVNCYTTSIYSNSARIAFVWIKYKVSVCTTTME